MGREDLALELQQDIIATIELQQQQQQQQQQQHLDQERETANAVLSDGGVVRPVDGFAKNVNPNGQE